MVMSSGIGFKSRRPMVRTDFLDKSMLLERFQIFVNGGKRNGRDVRLHHAVDRFRTWVSAHPGQRFKNNLPLVGDSQAMTFAQLPERLLERIR